MNQIVNLTTTTANATLTMSSREIAELTGKLHKNVLRDIRDTLNGLKIEPVKFLAQYLDGKGEYRDAFNLPKRETLILVSGYSVELRARIIDRWMELEATISKPAPVLPQSFAEALRLAADEYEKRVAVEQEPEQAKPKALVGERVASHKDRSISRYAPGALTDQVTEIGVARFTAWSVRAREYAVPSAE